MATEKTTIRASSLPRLKVCPASYAESIGKPNPSSKEAALGSAFHECMATATDHGRADIDLEQVAAKHGCDVNELSTLWHRFDFDPSSGQAEVSVEFADERVAITGRLDWVSEIEPGVESLVDWKTTHRIEEDPEPWNDPQTKAYAVGRMIQKADTLFEVRTQKCYVRRGERGWSQTYTITREMVDEIANDLLDIATRAAQQVDLPADKRSYTLSSHCDYCPGRETCPAVRREVTAALSAIMDTPILKKDGTPSVRSETVVSLDLTVETIPKWHEVTRLLGRAKDALHEAIKRAVDALGPIEVSEGKFLAVKTSPRRVALTEKAIRAAAATAEIEPEKIEHMIQIIADRERRHESRLDIYTEETLSKSDA